MANAPRKATATEAARVWGEGWASKPALQNAGGDNYWLSPPDIEVTVLGQTRMAAWMLGTDGRWVSPAAAAGHSSTESPEEFESRFAEDVATAEAQAAPVLDGPAPEAPPADTGPETSLITTVPAGNGAGGCVGCGPGDSALLTAAPTRALFMQRAQMPPEAEGPAPEADGPADAMGALTREVASLPLWVWLLIVAVGLFGLTRGR